MDFHLDRDLSISLIEQIKGQITYGIALGKLSAGTPMPSVRELAQKLNVAPMTVARVYRELTQRGLLVTQPRLGTFVADIGNLQVGNAYHFSRERLRQIVDRCLRQAMLQGYTLRETKQAFLDKAKDYEKAETKPHMVLVGNFLHTTQGYANEIERILGDLNIKVYPLELTELMNNLLAYDDLIKTAILTITIPTRLKEVRELLEPDRSRVVAVAFQLSQEIRNQLFALSHSSRLGIITTYPEFLQIMLNEVYSYGLVKNPPICAVYTQVDAIHEMFSQIDVLIYASGSESVLKDLPKNVKAIEFLHEPVPQSVNRLRSFIVPVVAPKPMEGPVRTKNVHPSSAAQTEVVTVPLEKVTD